MIDMNTDRSGDISPGLFDDGSNISQKSLLDPTFDDTRRRLAFGNLKLARNNRGTDDFGGIDDFLDTRYTQRDVHGGDTCEMESLQGHLCTGFSDGLGADSSDR